MVLKMTVMFLWANTNVAVRNTCIGSGGFGAGSVTETGI